MIHDTAIAHTTSLIDPTAIIHEDVVIGPYCVIGPNVIIGAGTVIEPHVRVGGPPEHTDRKKIIFRSDLHVIIGKNCIIRAFCTIDHGTSRNTTIGDECLLFARSHVGHDTILQNNVVLAQANASGHCFLSEGVFMGIGSVLHPRTFVPPRVCIGMNSTVTKRTVMKPFYKYQGSPARETEFNAVGYERAGGGKKARELVELAQLNRAEHAKYVGAL